MAPKLKFPCPCGLRSPTALMMRAACRTAFQWMPSSLATMMFALRRLPAWDKTSISTSTGPVSSLSFTIAGPMLGANPSVAAKSLMPRNSARASARLSPRVYSGNGCVEIRIPATSYPQP